MIRIKLSISFLIAAFAAATVQSAAINTLLSNEITGLHIGGDSLWVMTAKGLNITADGGLTWTGFDSSHGIGAGAPGPGTLVTAFGRTLVSTFIASGSSFRGTGIAQFNPSSEVWTNTNFSWRKDATEKAGAGAAAGDSLFLFAYCQGGILVKDLKADTNWAVRVPDTLGQVSAMRSIDFPPDSFLITDSTAPDNKSLMPMYAVWSVTLDTAGSGPSRIYAGTSDGLYVSTDRCSSWSRITLPQNAGREVIGLWVQPVGGSSVIWASVQKNVKMDASDRSPALLRSADNGTQWTAIEGFKDNLPTDMAFAGDAAWATTGIGLFRIQNTSAVQQPSYFDGRGLFQKTKTGFNAIEAQTGTNQDTVLWVGAGAGLFKSNNAGMDWDSPIRICPAISPKLRQVYAAPNLIGYQTGFVTFVYNLEKSGRTTIEVFDWNMDKVKTVIRDQPRNAGAAAPNGRSTRDFEDKWDGTNSRGERVAIGTYYFRVKTDKGETGFGKIVVAR